VELSRLVLGGVLIAIGIALTIATWGESPGTTSGLGVEAIRYGPMIAGVVVLLRTGTAKVPGQQAIASFVLGRLASGALSMLGVSVLVFAFLHLVPGDPVDQLAGGEATVEQRQKIEACMGLDRPLAIQFATFLDRVLDGTLGHQCPRQAKQPTVAGRVFEVVPYTATLAVAGMLCAILFALPLGIIAAIRRGTWIDTLATTTALSGIAIPQMMFAPLLVLIFFAILGWFPGPTETGPAALVLPAFAVGTHLMAMLARMTRSSMVEVLGEDYVRTARAKGVPEGRVLFVHALRNALLPVITIAGLQFGSLLSGAIVIEHIFARPGLGTTLLEAILERNYPVVQGTVLVIAAIYVLVNILVDLAYGLADPRIRRA
jgi:ABC-type dipeptide/oligopeptide/nickel transport system permease component